MFDVHAAGRGHLYPGNQYFTLSRGVSAYTTHRYGQDVEGKCGGAVVKGSIESMQIGPLGQFLANGGAYAGLLGRSYDVRSLADAIETAFKKDAKDTTAVDPREIYTIIHVRVNEVIDPAVEEPVAA